MAFYNSASGNSIWRGYDYYKDKKIQKYKKIDDNHFQTTFRGSVGDYDVFIDIEHPKNSTCTCPHANGKKIICKHMIALYFTAFPEEADILLEKSKEYEKDEEERLDKLYSDVDKYIRKMSKQELVEQLEYILEISPDWVYDRFVRDNDIGYL